MLRLRASVVVQGPGTLSLGVCAVALLLAACGQKGALVLPKPPAGAASSAPAPTAPVIVPSSPRP